MSKSVEDKIAIMEARLQQRCRDGGTRVSCLMGNHYVNGARDVQLTVRTDRVAGVYHCSYTSVRFDLDDSEQWVNAERIFAGVVDKL